MTYSNRAQIALNLGGLIADGFIAVEAKDGQQVKNIGSDIIKLGKALGVSEQLLSRGNSINEFAEHNEWDTLQEELEATQNEVKSSMQSHADQDLVILVTLGGWIRGTQVVTGAILKNYSESAASVLRQPAQGPARGSSVAAVELLLQVAVDHPGALTALVDRPDDQRLAAACVTGREDPLH